MDLWWNDITAEDLELDERESVCEVCHLVYWTATGCTVCADN